MNLYIHENTIHKTRKYAHTCIHTFFGQTHNLLRECDRSRVRPFLRRIGLIPSPSLTPPIGS